VFDNFLYNSHGEKRRGETLKIVSYDVEINKN
jgi:hypothetical protein